MLVRPRPIRSFSSSARSLWLRAATSLRSAIADPRSAPLRSATIFPFRTHPPTMILRTLPFLLLGLPCQAQFALEQSYPNAATPNTDKQLFLVELEDLGHRYVLFNKTTKTLTFFDLDHVQVQVIDLSAAPGTDGSNGGQVLYITQYLFDLDPGIELMYFEGGGSAPLTVVTSIMDESGAVIQSFPNEAAYVMVNVPQLQFPITNTPDGTKLILSNLSNLEARVYALPGELSTGMALDQPPTLAGTVKVYPNPNSGEVTIAMDAISAFGDLLIRFHAPGGALALEQRLAGASTTIATDRLAAGNYTYVITRDGVPWQAGTLVKH